MKILVVGESCKDIFVYGECNRICPEAPVPVFVPIREAINSGMAMNVRNNIISLGIESDIVTNENWETVKKSRFIDDRTNQMFLRVDKNDSKVLTLSDESKILLLNNVEKYDAVVISDYCKGFVTPQLIEEICNLHSTVFLDTKKLLGPWCRKAKFIKINEVEYERTKHLVDSHIRSNLIITRGSKGCQYRGEMFEVPRVEIKDVSGAGDTFIAALAVSYIKNQDIRKSIDFANTKATEVVQRRGVSIV